VFHTPGVSFTSLPVGVHYLHNDYLGSTFSDAEDDYARAMVALYVDGGSVDCGGVISDQFAYYQSSDDAVQCSGVTAHLERWYHVAVSRDGSGVRRFFVDGVLEDTDTGTTAPEDSAGRLSVGRSGDFDGEYWTGLIDEVRVSSAAVYTATFRPPFEPLSSGASMVGLWHFDEGAGQTVADSSGNGRDGTLGADDGADSDDPAWSTDSPVVCAEESDETTTAITYTYDALNRLTEAEYSDGTFYEYEYDQVGNRLALTTTAGTITWCSPPPKRIF
jgi:YD repeat-containing protein